LSKGKHTHHEDRTPLPRAEIEKGRLLGEHGKFI